MGWFATFSTVKKKEIVRLTVTKLLTNILLLKDREDRIYVRFVRESRYFYPYQEFINVILPK